VTAEPVLSNPASPWMTDEARAFRKKVRQFIQNELAPHQDRWSKQGHPDADVWPKAGSMGVLLPEVPQEYGGSGGTFATSGWASRADGSQSVWS